MVDIINFLINRDNITLLIALWGAILATIKVVYDYQNKTRRINVKVSKGFVLQGSTIVSPDIISITAINKGYRDVILNSVGLMIPNNTVLIREINTDVQFPYPLKDDQSCIVYKKIPELSQELQKHGYSGKIKLRGYYTSATG